MDLLRTPSPSPITTWQGLENLTDSDNSPVPQCLFCSKSYRWGKGEVECHMDPTITNTTVGTVKETRFTIKLDRLIVLSKSILLVWFLHVSLIVIIKGRSPMEVSLIVIIKQVSTWLSLIIKLFHHFSPNLSNCAHDSQDQTHDRIKI